MEDKRLNIPIDPYIRDKLKQKYPGTMGEAVLRFIKQDLEILNNSTKIKIQSITKEIESLTLDLKSEEEKLKWELKQKLEYLKSLPVKKSWRYKQDWWKDNFDMVPMYSEMSVCYDDLDELWEEI